jgi:polyhydroxyalkanoate synthase
VNRALGKRTKKKYENLKEIKKPTCVIRGTSDRIVPMASSDSLIDLIPHAAVIDAPLGHLGLLVGSKAPGLVWEIYGDWIRR